MTLLLDYSTGVRALESQPGTFGIGWEWLSVEEAVVPPTTPDFPAWAITVQPNAPRWVMSFDLAAPAWPIIVEPKAPAWRITS